MALDLGTDDKKKLYILGGLLAVFAVVGLVVFNPFGGKKTSAPSTVANTTTGPPGTSPATTPPISPGALTGGPGANPLAGGAATSAGPTGTTGGSAAQYIAFRQARTDPFVPHYISAIPLARRPKPPPPPRPPLDLPSPGDESGSIFPSGDGGLMLPPARVVSGAGSGDNGVLTNLPQVSIPQYKPREAPRLTSSSPFETGGGSESTTARLAGVVIGDSVRALVEVTRPDGQVVSRVVQPGDEIEGIRVLRLERVTEGGQSVTRMTVSQNGREQYFTLRPSNAPRNTGGLGAGGFPGGFMTP